MKKQLLLGVLCLIGITLESYAQFENGIEDFGSAREVYLGYPNTREGTQLLPVGIDLWDGDDVNTIHYGRTPSNFQNKPVLVFVHGYASRASVWFEGDDNMYADVYKDGYRAAFVSLAPNKHVWTNGNMLSNAIDQITAHFGVNKVTVIGWSKGGVDTDAAIVHFGANDKVSEVFTLSTPHNGTAIAEWANSILLSLVNVVFMQDNDATRSLQRGYMNYFRSITDNNSNNTVKYTTIGGWGNGPLARLSIPQGLLYVDGGSKSSGGNDGVVPYKSSRRPGGLELFGGQKKDYYWWGGWHYPGPSQTNLDHFEVTRGGLVWPHIKARLGNRASRLQVNTTSENYNPNTIAYSKLQIVTGTKGKKSFHVEPNAGKVMILLGQKEGTKINARISQAGNSVELKKVNLGTNSKENIGLYEFQNTNGGEFSIDAANSFVAMISTENGVELALHTGLSNDKLVYKTEDDLRLKLSLLNAKGIDYNQTLITGTIQRTSNLSLKKTNDQPQLLQFKQEGLSFELSNTPQLLPGIYTVTVNAQQGNTFNKTVVTTIAVVGEEKQLEEKMNLLSIETAYPNPFKESLQLRLNLGEGKNTSLKIFNIYGQEVSSFDLSDQTGLVNFTWDAKRQNMDSGMYIIQLSNGIDNITQKVIMK